MASDFELGFFSWNAGQGAGVVDCSQTVQIDGALMDDQRNAIPWMPIGSARATELAGVISASRLVGMYQPPLQSTQQYLDAIAAFSLKTAQTIVIRRTSAAAGAANHQMTITGYLMKSPLAGMIHGEPIRYPLDLAVHSVVHTDGTTTYTWGVAAT